MKTYKLSYKKTSNGAININQNKRCKSYSHSHTRSGKAKIVDFIWTTTKLKYVVQP